MFRIEITASAESDLDGITDYIGRMLCNPPAVAALLETIESACARIAEMPDVFPPCADPRLAELGYRKAVVRSYVMVYEIDLPGRVARIMRFFHESENYVDKL